LKPLLKWAGGKSRIYQNIRNLLPNTIKGKYIEPFFGGGAVFFDYLDDPLRKDVPRVIADANPALMNFYRLLADGFADQVHDVAQRLLDDHADPLAYYRVRESFNKSLASGLSDVFTIDYAGEFAYLNKTCFNGLWRVHQTKGTFNVPRGSYRSIQLPSYDEYQKAASMLAGTLMLFDYRDSLVPATEGDVVYADPPYVDTFTGYAKGGFGEGDQRELSDELKAAARRGAHVVLSINDCPLARELYAGSVFTELKVRHAVGAKEDRRRDVAELLIVVRP
jgi:DNA adenine methylase